MAELGALASGITVAALIPHIARGIVELKDFISSVKNAPKELQNLVSGIESLTELLDHCSSNAAAQEPDISEKYALLSLDHCRVALGDLKAVALCLVEGVKRRRRLGSFMAVLKRSELDRLGGKLETAKSSLMLSRQVLLEAALQRDREALLVTQAKQRLQLESIQTNVLITMGAVLQSSKRMEPATLVEETTEQSTEEGSYEIVRKPARTNRTTISSRQKSGTVKVRLPFWMKSRSNAFEFGLSTDDYGEWKIILRSYSVIPSNSPVVAFVLNSDMNALQELFSKNLASPNDKTDLGNSLLFHAVMSRQAEVCEFLLQSGARLSDQPYSSFSTELSFALSIENALSSQQEHLRLLRSLAKYVDSENFCLHTNNTFEGHPEVLTWVLNQTKIEGRQRSIEESGDLALLVAQTNLFNLSTSVRIALEGRPICREICQMYDDWNAGLIHYAGRELGLLFGLDSNASTRHSSHTYSQGAKHVRTEDPKKCENDQTLEKLISLLCDLIIGGSELHRRAVISYRSLSDYKTPFLAIFNSLEWPLNDSLFKHVGVVSRSFEMMPPVLLWLRSLQKCGVDLDAYGREEKELHLRGVVNHRIFVPRARQNDDEFDELEYDQYWVHFIYGPQPEDWKVWLFSVMENWFLQFWNMVEHPELGMPGAWNDDDEFDGEGYYSDIDTDDSNSV